jgi:malonyl CoA-acyl carrier protein transacylase
VPQPPSVLLFSGFGTSGPGLVGQLQALYRQPGHRPLLDTAADAVERAVDRFGPDAVRRLVPGGLPLRGWLRGQAPAAPAVLRRSVVEGLLTQLMHLCLLRPGAAWRTGVPVVGLGHSLGLISAVVAGLRTDGDRQFLADARESLTMTVLTLLRCQQAAGDQRADPALARRYAEDGGTDRPGPMAAVRGAEAGALRELVAGHDQPDGRPIELGLLNGPKDVVLCGDTTALLRFRAQQGPALARLGVSWTFLRSTVPFHHSRLAPVLADLAADRAWAGTAIGADRLAAPVYATDTPRNLQQAPDLYADCLAQVVCRPLDWAATVREVMTEHGPSQALDFGPGVAVRMFTRSCLDADGRSLEYRTVRT